MATTGPTTTASFPAKERAYYDALLKSVESGQRNTDQVLAILRQKDARLEPRFKLYCQLGSAEAKERIEARENASAQRQAELAILVAQRQQLVAQRDAIDARMEQRREDATVKVKNGLN